jgi:hypothetical protein
MNAANALVRVQSAGILHPNSLTPKDVARHAYLWNFEQLNEMVAIINGLLDAQGTQDNGNVAKVSKNKRGRPAGSGYFESKLIRGYGPYRYLRYWQNGQRRSVYLGKANEESNDADGVQCVKTT